MHSDRLIRCIRTPKDTGRHRQTQTYTDRQAHRQKYGLVHTPIYRDVSWGIGAFVPSEFE